MLEHFQKDDMESISMQIDQDHAQAVFEIIYWKRFHFLSDTSASSGCQYECFQFIRKLK